MRNVRWNKPTRHLGAPQNWDEEANGPCLGISVLDHRLDMGEDPRTGQRQEAMIMYTAWRPTAEEMELLKKGHPLILGIFGKDHPVIQLLVGDESIPNATTQPITIVGRMN